MGDQKIDFSLPGNLTPGSTADTGEADTASIRPILNGNPGNAVNFARPSENLRNRTEVLRQAAEDSKYLQDADRALLMEGGGNIIWGGSSHEGGTGIFTIDANLIIRPFIGLNDQSNPASRLVGGDPTTSVLLRTNSTIVGGINPPRAYSGANKISVRVTGSDGGTLGVTVAGTPADDITININTNVSSGTTVQQLINFLNSSSAFTNLGVQAFAGPAVTDTSLKVQGADGVVYYFAGAVDAEVHKITPAGLATFFSVTSNLMSSGSVLCVGYDTLVDAPGSYGGRRQSTDDSPETLGMAPRIDNTNVDNNLFLLENHPERLPYAIPVATISGGELVLLTMDRFPKNIPGTLGGTLGSTGATTLGLPLDAYSPATAKKYRFTVNSALNALALRVQDINTPWDGTETGIKLDLGAIGQAIVGAAGKLQVGTGIGGDIILAQVSVDGGAPGSRQGALTLYNESDSSHTQLNKTLLDTLIASAGGGTPPTPSPVSLSAAAVGVSAGLARGDHVHLLATSVTTPVSNIPAAAGTAGTSTSVARSDHQHPTPVAAPIALVPNAATSVGTASTLARSDHSHAIAAGAAVSQPLDAANGTGTSTSFARADHTHSMPGYSGAMTAISDSAGSVGAATQPSRGDHTHLHGSLGGNTDHAVAVANSATGAGFISSTDKNKVDLLPIHNNYSESFVNTLFPPSFFKQGADVTPDGANTQSWFRTTSLINGIFGSAAAQPNIALSGSLAYMQFDVYLETEGRVRFDYALVNSTAGSMKVYATGPYNDYSTSLTPLLVATGTTAVQTQSGTQNWGSFVTPLLPPGHTKLIFEYIRSNTTAVAGEKCQVGNFKILAPSSAGVYGHYEDFDSEVPSSTTPPTYGFVANGTLSYLDINNTGFGTPPGKTGAIQLNSGSGSTAPVSFQSARKPVNRTNRWTLDFCALPSGMDTVVDFGITDWALTATNYVRFLITNTNNGSGGDNPGFITCNVKASASTGTATTSIVMDSVNYHDYHIEVLDDVGTRFYYDGLMIAHITSPLSANAGIGAPYFRHTNTQTGSKTSYLDSFRINTNVKAYL